MAAEAEDNSSLASQCLALCQALASQGQEFTFSVNIGSSFSFSLDTRKKIPEVKPLGKRSSPSTQRRNARRRQAFLKKKAEPPASSLGESQHEVSVEEAEDREKVEVKTFKCDQCEYVAASEKGLRQHIRMKHKKEELRSSHEGPLHVSISPLLDASREELLDASMEEPTTPFIGMCRGDDCNVRLTGMFCCEKTKLLCEDCCGHYL